MENLHRGAIDMADLSANDDMQMQNQLPLPSRSVEQLGPSTSVGEISEGGGLERPLNNPWAAAANFHSSPDYTPPESSPGQPGPSPEFAAPKKASLQTLHNTTKIRTMDGSPPFTPHRPSTFNAHGHAHPLLPPHSQPENSPFENRKRRKTNSSRRTDLPSNFATPPSTPSAFKHPPASASTPAPTPGFFGLQARGQLRRPNQPVQLPPSTQDIQVCLAEVVTTLESLKTGIIPTMTTMAENIASLAADKLELQQKLDRLDKRTEQEYQDLKQDQRSLRKETKQAVSETNEKMDELWDNVLDARGAKPVSGGAYGGPKYGAMPRSSGLLEGLIRPRN